jgi:hypothetical protein
MYTQYEQAWLEDPSAIRIVLVEAQVYNVLTSTNTYLYLSTDNYITTDGSISFLSIIKNNITLNETLSADGSGAMTFGDIEIANHNGDYDVYFDKDKYIWSNRTIKIYYGDARWTCANLAEIVSKFKLIFNGIIDDADSRNRVSFNIKIRDKLERLNAPVTVDKLGPFGTWAGGQQNIDAVKPLVFGEVFNITPMLIDPSFLKYMFNNGPSSALVEIRDNGAPLNTDIVTGLTISATVSSGTITAASISAGGSNYMISDKVYVIDSNSNTNAVFTANIANTTLSIVSVASGVISVGMKVTGIGIPVNTVITGGSGSSFTVNNTVTTSTSASLTGVNTLAVINITGVSAGVVTSIIVENGGTGYLGNGTKLTGLYKISTTRTTSVVDNSVGIFCLAAQPAGSITCSVRGINNSINLTTGALTTGTYSNTIASMIALIATQYGKENTRFNYTDLDLVNLSAAATSLTGIVVSDTANVLTVCKQLVNSIGCQIFITRGGLLQILRYGVGYVNDRDITTITESDIVYNSLMISNRLPVIGAVKLGYAKNYTVQNGLLTRILQAHKDMFAQDWLSLTILNQPVITKYALSQDVTQTDTQLINADEALTEAKRRLDFYSSQRIVYRFTGISKLLGLKLGQQVTLIHSRFNLYNSGSGVAGQVITLLPNWTTGHVDVEVLI